MTLVLAFGRQRQVELLSEVTWFQGSEGYTVKPCVKQKEMKLDEFVKAQRPENLRIPNTFCLEFCFCLCDQSYHYLCPAVYVEVCRRGRAVRLSSVDCVLRNVMEANYEGDSSCLWSRISAFRI